MATLDVSHQGHDVLPSLTLDMRPSEGQVMTVEEEKDYYRQRFMSLRLVLKEVQQQLSQYKNRCAGVDTVTLLLKESKQEVVRLSRKCKVMETAVANLQNRLHTNGLSSSVAIEETEMFVPGASKQTLDNLARENARLRSLLKNSEGQVGKKPSEEVQTLKAEIEKSEIENSKLHMKIDEMVVMKNQTESNRNLRDGNEQFGFSTKSQREVNYSESGVVSRGCQTTEFAPSMIEKLKESLKQMTEHCSQFQSQLEKSQVVDEEDFDKNVVTGRTDKSDSVIEKELEWKKKYQDVVIMNQRWQQHNDEQMRNTHALVSRIAELEDPETINVIVTNATAASKREIERIKAQLESVTVENNELKQRLDTISKERRNQPQFDMSIVEILKQQIQACTEDFNSERKDREQAVQRAEQLQAELAALRTQYDKLTIDHEQFKQMSVPQFGQTQRDVQLSVKAPRPATPSVPLSQLRARGPSSAHMLPPRIPYHLIPPAMGWYKQSSQSSQDSDYLSDHSGHQSSIDASTLEGSEFLSMQCRTLEADTESENQDSSKYNNAASMPVLSVKQDKKGALSHCFKCNKEFFENQSEEFLKHLDDCTALTPMSNTLES